MNIIFSGSKGKTGSIVFNYLKEKGYSISNEINLGETKLEDVIEPSSIIIDFTNKETALNHARICLNNNSHFICGTTGIDTKQIENLISEAKQKRLNFIFNPNFSNGLNSLIPLLKSLKEDLPNISIIESHHISKKDLPSGTALLLKKELENISCIESIRTTYPSLTHKIIFKNDYEEITIKHDVKSKLAYAIGVEKCLKSLLNSLKYD